MPQAPAINPSTFGADRQRRTATLIPPGGDAGDRPTGLAINDAANLVKFHFNFKVALYSMQANYFIGCLHRIEIAWQNAS